MIEIPFLWCTLESKDFRKNKKIKGQKIFQEKKKRSNSQKISSTSSNVSDQVIMAVWGVVGEGRGVIY